ncbi:sodium channel protein Nach-like [Sitophilus oryzae]|uniref:Sodium channel protein Nach-like n=1 Tax=Sitophilus oryzae TaxID=7048 RepID=A0A6J2Y1C6_SITOR|nr:sodium channel protein Nach-like [Sitophilus oryzae]
MSKVLKNIKDLFKNTSIEGLKFCIFSKNLYERLFWTLVVICTLACSGYVTALFWNRYVSNPKRITLKTGFASPLTVPFPGVTICNFNVALVSKINNFLNKLDGTPEELNIVNETLSKWVAVEVITQTTSQINSTNLELIQNILDKNDYNEMRSILRQVTQTCDELLIKCSWNKKPIKCNKIFEEIYIGSGRCCSFNYVPETSNRKPVHTSKIGLFTGLKVWIKPEYNTRDFAGVGVIFHDPKDFPYKTEARKTLSLGTLNYVHVEASRKGCSSTVKSLPISQRQCIYEDEKKIDFFRKYSITNCFIACKAEVFFKECHCIPHFFGFGHDKPVCTVEKLSCIEENNNVLKHNCDCPAECEFDVYKVVASSTKILPTNNTIENMGDLVFINIFFNIHHRIWMTDTINTSIYLWSSFGGIYSLFLGCSFISIIEVFYYMVGKSIDLNMMTDQQKKLMPTRNKIQIQTFKIEKQPSKYPDIPFTN